MSLLHILTLWGSYVFQICYFSFCFVIGDFCCTEERHFYTVPYFKRFCRASSMAARGERHSVVYSSMHTHTHTHISMVSKFSSFGIYSVYSMKEEYTVFSPPPIPFIKKKSFSRLFEMLTWSYSKLTWVCFWALHSCLFLYQCCNVLLRLF